MGRSTYAGLDQLFPVLNDSPPSPNESDGTLFNPPTTPDAASTAEESTVGLRLSLTEEEADRLRSVAQQLGLTPSILAQRAIKMVCEEVVTIQEDSRSPNLMVDQYQARIDLLHAVEENGSSPSPASDDRDGGRPSRDGNSSYCEDTTHS